MSKKKDAIKEIDINSIPESTELFGRVIRTSYDERYTDYKGYQGEAKLTHGEILIANSVEGKDIPDDIKKITYLHELVHHILYVTGYHDIITDKKPIDLEQFTELMANALYDSLYKSVKY